MTLNGQPSGNRNIYHQFIYSLAGMNYSATLVLGIYILLGKLDSLLDPAASFASNTLFGSLEINI